MAVRSEEITSLIRQQIERFGADVKAIDVGTVVEAGDGIARIQGLAGARASELLEFPKSGAFGLALNLEEDAVGAVILGDYTKVVEGDEVRGTGRIIEVPVGPALIGRTVNALGQPIDGKGPVNAEKYRPVERIAPNVVMRSSVNQPVQTGIKAIDAMIPIGRGQRELVIGDRGTGKTAVCIDAILNQTPDDMVCIYVAIGQRASRIAQVVGALEARGAMDRTIVVTASASESAALQYIAPYAGCAMGEEFMEQGRDVLIIYDDLSKHAWAYRQMSLLLRRPPGREAYPGDVFYLHSRLLERAAKIGKEWGGGSITALPIIETQAGDVSAYIPTNVISITDGQIFLEGDLFFSGIRPAINAGISVSRVGSTAQTKAMKTVSGRLKLELSQYRNLAAFAQFGAADMDRSTRMQLERGQRVTELLKQGQYEPVPLEKQVALFYALSNGYLDEVPVDKVRTYESELYKYLDLNSPDLLNDIRTAKVVTPEIADRLKATVTEFNAGRTW